MKKQKFDVGVIEKSHKDYAIIVLDYKNQDSPSIVFKGTMQECKNYILERKKSLQF